MKLLILFACLGFASSYTLTQEQYDSAVSNMEAFFRNNGSCLPTAVRLAFHDCVSGTCDGCINVDNGSNAGLEECIGVFEAEFQANYADHIWRADFWAITAIGAIKRGISLAQRLCEEDVCINDLDITFKYGRENCSTSPYTDEIFEFPEPTMNAVDMYSYYTTHFGFTNREVVALMGAHTLGSAAKVNSGYVGPWIGGEVAQFDNKFYRNMNETTRGEDATIIYSPINRSPSSRTDDKWQWIDDEATTGMMLNTDMELFWDLQLDSDGKAGCSLTPGASDFCSPYTTYDDAQEFANDVNLWLTEFTAVFTKMIEHGSTLSSLQ